MSMNRVDPVTGELTLVAGRNVSTMVPSAGLMQRGTHSISQFISGWFQRTVHLATPMPDTNYDVSLSIKTVGLVPNLEVRNKTATSFNILVNFGDSLPDDTFEIDWTAVRLMTDQTTALDEAGIAAAMKYKIGESSVKANPSLPYDANSLTSVGVYSVLASITANLPVNTQEWVTVYVTQSASNPDHVQQIAIRGAENKVYSRILYNGAWGEWQQLTPTSTVTSGSTAPITSGGVFNALSCSKLVFRGVISAQKVTLGGSGVYLVTVDNHGYGNQLACALIATFANNSKNVIMLGNSFVQTPTFTWNSTNNELSVTITGESQAVDASVNALYVGGYY